MTAFVFVCADVGLVSTVNSARLPIPREPSYRGHVNCYHHCSPRPGKRFVYRGPFEVKGRCADQGDGTGWSAHTMQ